MSDPPSGPVAPPALPDAAGTPAQTFGDEGAVPQLTVGPPVEAVVVDVVPVDASQDALSTFPSLPEEGADRYKDPGVEVTQTGSQREGSQEPPRPPSAPKPSARRTTTTSTKSSTSSSSRAQAPKTPSSSRTAQQLPPSSSAPAGFPLAAVLLPLAGVLVASAVVLWRRRSRQVLGGEEGGHPGPQNTSTTAAASQNGEEHRIKKRKKKAPAGDDAAPNGSSSRRVGKRKTKTEGSAAKNSTAAPAGGGGSGGGHNPAQAPREEPPAEVAEPDSLPMLCHRYEGGIVPSDVTVVSKTLAGMTVVVSQGIDVVGDVTTFGDGGTISGSAPAPQDSTSSPAEAQQRPATTDSDAPLQPGATVSGTESGTAAEGAEEVDKGPDGMNGHAGTPATASESPATAVTGPAEDVPAAATDEVVKRLCENGVTVVGRAAMQPLTPDGGDLLGANFGNPAIKLRIAGGGCTGAVACAATDVATVVVGTDYLGQLRVPSACCGVFCFRPSAAPIATDAAAGSSSSSRAAASSGGGGAGGFASGVVSVASQQMMVLQNVARVMGAPGNPNLRGELIKFVVAEDLFALCGVELQPVLVAAKKAIVGWAGADQAGSVQLCKFLANNTTAWQQFRDRQDAQGQREGDVTASLQALGVAPVPSVLEALRSAALVLQELEIKQLLSRHHHGPPTPSAVVDDDDEPVVPPTAAGKGDAPAAGSGAADATAPAGPSDNTDTAVGKDATAAAAAGPSNAATASASVAGAPPPSGGDATAAAATSAADAAAASATAAAATSADAAAPATDGGSAYPASATAATPAPPAPSSGQGAQGEAESSALPLNHGDVSSAVAQFDGSAAAPAPGSSSTAAPAVGGGSSGVCEAVLTVVDGPSDSPGLTPAEVAAAVVAAETDAEAVVPGGTEAAAAETDAETAVTTDNAGPDPAPGDVEDAAGEPSVSADAAAGCEAGDAAAAASDAPSADAWSANSDVFRQARGVAEGIMARADSMVDTPRNTLGDIGGSSAGYEADNEASFTGGVGVGERAGYRGGGERAGYGGVVGGSGGKGGEAQATHMVPSTPSASATAAAAETEAPIAEGDVTSAGPHSGTTPSPVSPPEQAVEQAAPTSGASHTALTAVEPRVPAGAVTLDADTATPPGPETKASAIAEAAPAAATADVAEAAQPGAELAATLATATAPLATAAASSDSGEVQPTPEGLPADSAAPEAKESAPAGASAAEAGEAAEAPEGPGGAAAAGTKDVAAAAAKEVPAARKEEAVAATKEVAASAAAAFDPVAAARQVAREVFECLRTTVKSDTMMIIPSLPLAPPRRDAVGGPEGAVFAHLAQIFCSLPTLSACPSVTLPVGTLMDGTPVSITMFTVHRFDLRLLAVAQKLYPMLQTEFNNVKRELAQRYAAAAAATAGGTPALPSGATDAASGTPVGGTVKGGSSKKSGTAKTANGPAGHKAVGLTSNGGTVAGKAVPPAVDQKRLDKAEQYKTRGNEYFKAGRYAEAVNEYGRAINEIPGGSAVYYSNRAMANLKIFRFEQAEEDSERALKFDLREADRVKALLRRATARMALDKFTPAEADLKLVLNLEPNNRQARDDLAELRARREEMQAAQLRMVQEYRATAAQQAAGGTQPQPGHGAQPYGGMMGYPGAGGGMPPGMAGMDPAGGGEGYEYVDESGAPIPHDVAMQMLAAAQAGGGF